MRSRGPGRWSRPTSANAIHIWREDVCAEGNNQVRIGKENYMLSADGELMPAKKNQSPPDLRYFQQTKK